MADSNDEPLDTGPFLLADLMAGFLAGTFLAGSFLAGGFLTTIEIEEEYVADGATTLVVNAEGATNAQAEATDVSATAISIFMLARFQL